MTSTIAASLRHIELALYQVVEFDLYDIKATGSVPLLHFKRVRRIRFLIIVQEDAVIPKQITQGSYPRKIFKHFRNDAVVWNVIKFCRLLGYYGDRIMLVDHFLSAIRIENDYSHKKHAIFILNEMILGFAAVGIETDVTLKHQQGNNEYEMNLNLKENDLRSFSFKFKFISYSLDRRDSNYTGPFLVGCFCCTSS